jgi:hypothetical protein
VSVDGLPTPMALRLVLASAGFYPQAEVGGLGFFWGLVSRPVVLTGEATVSQLVSLGGLPTPLAINMFLSYLGLFPNGSGGFFLGIPLPRLVGDLAAYSRQVPEVIGARPTLTPIGGFTPWALRLCLHYVGLLPNGEGGYFSGFPLPRLVAEFPVLPANGPWGVMDTFGPNGVPTLKAFRALLGYLGLGFLDSSDWSASDIPEFRWEVLWLAALGGQG